MESIRVRLIARRQHESEVVNDGKDNEDGDAMANQINTCLWMKKATALSIVFVYLHVFIVLYHSKLSILIECITFSKFQAQLFTESA